MNPRRAFVTGVGVVGPAGVGLEVLRDAVAAGQRHLAPLTLFPTPSTAAHPVGEIATIDTTHGSLPRTHRLALAALEQLNLAHAVPDWILLGTTTGGMLTTEELFRQEVRDPTPYRYHGLSTVADELRRALGLSIPTLTLSTACSSGAVALILGLALIRSGRARCVIAGGVDSLCRLTYHGFSLLQIVDPQGARPLDVNRKGMTVAEAAALFLLEGADTPPAAARAELLGGGLSCDAYHATAPRADGTGAARAMKLALRDAGVRAREVDYLNLHGTGTPDNDAAEAKAVHEIFGDAHPALSSTKGAFGHSLAASGAFEAAIATICIEDGLRPANVGLETLDPDLRLDPVRQPSSGAVRVVQSNSLGFGGNNASLVLGHPDAGLRTPPLPSASRTLSVLGSGCFTSAGDTAATLERLGAGEACTGRLGEEVLAARLPGRTFRRMKRLPRLALAAAREALAGIGEDLTPAAVVWATGWGSLSESHDFLTKLFASNEAFSSPIDFTSSVHNATAGQLAIHWSATGPNVTTSGTTDSFWQAVVAAELLADGEPQLLIGGDEYHEVFTPLVDPTASGTPSDGAAAVLVRRAADTDSGAYLSTAVSAASGDRDAVEELVDRLGGASDLRRRLGALWLGLPLRDPALVAAQRKTLERLLGPDLPTIDYRRWLGHYPTVSAVAVVLALHALNGELPLSGLADGKSSGAPSGPVHLVLELGSPLSALEVGRR
ncbi:MAG: beta-ketoacyl synthase N-terminal-like domain-containing protein [bacterium]